LDMTVALYENNYTPVATSVIGDFTLSSFTGSTPQLVVWSGSPATDGSGYAAISGVAQDYIVGDTSGPYTIYGYIVKSNAGALIYAERFSSGAVTLLDILDKLTIVPKLKLRSES